MEDDGMFTFISSQRVVDMVRYLTFAFERIKFLHIDQNAGVTACESSSAASAW
jgi:hypothetical protein